MLHIPDAPWDWNIYLHQWLKFIVNVGTYSIHGAYGYPPVRLNVFVYFLDFCQTNMFQPDVAAKKSVAAVQVLVSSVSHDLLANVGHKGLFVYPTGSMYGIFTYI